MKRKWWMIPLASLLVMAGLFLAAVQADAPSGAAGPATMALNPEQLAADQQLAEHLCLVAAQKLGNAQSLDAEMPQSLALLQAAVRLNPAEPRFLRLLADAQLNGQANDDALKAAQAKTLQAYIALNRTDTFAQSQLIALTVAQQEGVSAKLKYLNQIIGSPLAAEVRSFAATMAGQLLAKEQADTNGALEMYKKALDLNPVNLDALRGKYDLTSKDVSAAARVSQLLAMLKSNPGQPEVATRLALHLAAAGMVNESVIWFQFAESLYESTRQFPSPEFGQAAPAEYFLADQPDAALAMLQAYLQAYPGDDGGWNTLLAISKWEVERNPQDKTAKDKDDQYQKAAKAALLTRLQIVRAALGGAGASTQPIKPDDALKIPDLTGDADLLKKKNDDNLTGQYQSALEALAWLELYFCHDVNTADPLLEVLGTLLPNDDVTLTRLRGWRRLVNVDLPLARQKLEAVQSTDALSAMGVILLDLKQPDPKTVAQAKLRARQLLSAHPVGALAAVLYAEFHALEVKVEPSGNDAPVIAQLLKDFPLNWIDVLSKPQNFYSVKLESLQVTYDFAQPILLKVTLQNNSAFDLTIGPEGVIHRELWFDAHLLGGIGQAISGSAFDRLGQGLVLHPKKSISQIVRVDNQQLASLFYAPPQEAIPVDFTVITNFMPMSLPDNKGVKAVSGLAGIMTRTLNPVARNPVTISTPQAVALLAQRLAAAPVDERMRLLMAIRMYILPLRQAGGAALQVANDLEARLDHAVSTDTNATVRQWAVYQKVFVDAEQARNKAIMDLAASNMWIMRLLSLTVSPGMPDHGKAVATMLADDADPCVKVYAAATLVQLAKAATQPSMQPTTMPSTMPATMPTGL